MIPDKCGRCVFFKGGQCIKHNQYIKNFKPEEKETYNKINCSEYRLKWQLKCTQCGK